MTRRLLEPELELELVDDEHVLVRVFDDSHGLPGQGRQAIELVLEDAALRALSQRRVVLRLEEWGRQLGNA